MTCSLLQINIVDETFLLKCIKSYKYKYISNNFNNVRRVRLGVQYIIISCQ